MQAYDAAQLIDARSRRPAATSTTATRCAPRLKKADFKSLRGDFKFGTNHFPIQDFYLVKVAKRDDGKYADLDRREDLRRLPGQLRQASARCRTRRRGRARAMFNLFVLQLLNGVQFGVLLFLSRRG